ncbi:Flp pilus assembly protein CpaB [Nakamurella sp. UYEF19]|uniref:SAF domain-containing protein n=1 Tax=Nakamurella sp. UYEF19 TaxID=1756392 RepID=UPI003390BEE0
MRRGQGLQPQWRDRLSTRLTSRRRGGPRGRAARRAVAVLLFIAAGVLAATTRQDPVPGTDVVVAARDLPAGAALRASDLTIIRVPSLPDGALRSSSAATGRLLASPVRRGEMLTDVRLVPNNGPQAGPGRVAVPVRPSDAGTVGLLSPGVHVAVLSIADNGQGTVLAADAVVLAIPPPSPSDNAKRLVVLAVPTATADRITAAGSTGTIALRFAAG